MIKRIDNESEVLPTTVDETTVKSVKNDTHWNDFEFKCPICTETLIINSRLFVSQDDNDTQWLGNCPICKARIEIYYPD